MNELLNPYQKNSLRVSLLMLEDNLRQAQEWLDGREESGILYYRDLKISEETKQWAGLRIQAALELIEKLSSEFELNKEFQSAASILQGNLTVSWANLMDTKAGKLRRYGEVHPELSSMLDPDIQNLAEIAFHLSTMLGQSKQEKP
jgi:hypothetical protein